MSRDRADGGGAGDGSGQAQPRAGVGKRRLTDGMAAPVQQRAVPGATVETPESVALAAEAGTRGSPTGLPHLDTIQKSFGRHDVAGVGAHVGGAASAATEAMGAEAFAFGDQVAFGSAPTLHTAAHEAAHVVQQRAGVHLKSGVGEVGDAHEQHADAVADAVVGGRSAEGLLDRYAGGGSSAGVQRKLDVVPKSRVVQRLKVPARAAKIEIPREAYIPFDNEFKAELRDRGFDTARMSGKRLERLKLYLDQGFLTLPDGDVGALKAEVDARAAGEAKAAADEAEAKANTPEAKAERKRAADAAAAVEEYLQDWAEDHDAAKLRADLGGERDKAGIITGLAASAPGRALLKQVVITMDHGAGAPQKEVAHLALQSVFHINSIRGFRGRALARLWAVLERVPANHLDSRVNHALMEMFTISGVSSDHTGTGAQARIGAPAKHTDLDHVRLNTLLTTGVVKKVYGPLPFMSDMKSDYAHENAFDQTVLHEIGHAVDEKMKIMETHGKSRLFGQWHEYDLQPTDEMIAAYYAGGAGAGEDAPEFRRELRVWVDAALSGNFLNPSHSKRLAAHPRDTRVYKAAKAGSVLKLGGGKGMWQKSRLELDNFALNGMVFHKSYDARWSSYHVSARDTMVSFYQFRAPGEWFAELYACYFLGHLPQLNPVMATWFDDFVRTNPQLDAKAMRDPDAWKRDQDAKHERENPPLPPPPGYGEEKKDEKPAEPVAEAVAPPGDPVERELVGALRAEVKD